MTQKTGHALAGVTLITLFRRWVASLLLVAVAATGAFSAMVLQNLTIRQENALIASGILLEGEIQTSALMNAALVTGIFLLGSAIAAIQITSVNVMTLMKVED